MNNIVGIRTNDGEVQIFNVIGDFTYDEIADAVKFKIPDARPILVLVKNGK